MMNLTGEEEPYYYKYRYLFADQYFTLEGFNNERMRHYTNLIKSVGGEVGQGGPYILVKETYFREKIKNCQDVDYYNIQFISDCYNSKSLKDINSYKFDTNASHEAMKNKRCCTSKDTEKKISDANFSYNDEDVDCNKENDGDLSRNSTPGSIEDKSTHHHIQKLQTNVDTNISKSNKVLQINTETNMELVEDSFQDFCQNQNTVEDLSEYFTSDFIEDKSTIQKLQTNVDTNIPKSDEDLQIETETNMELDEDSFKDFCQNQNTVEETSSEYFTPVIIEDKSTHHHIQKLQTIVDTKIPRSDEVLQTETETNIEFDEDSFKDFCQNQNTVEETSNLKENHEKSSHSNSVDNLNGKDTINLINKTSQAASSSKTNVAKPTYHTKVVDTIKKRLESILISSHRSSDTDKLDKGCINVNNKNNTDYNREDEITKLSSSGSSISRKVSRVESDSDENTEDNLVINPYKKIKLAQDAVQSKTNVTKPTYHTKVVQTIKERIESILSSHKANSSRSSDTDKINKGCTSVNDESKMDHNHEDETTIPPSSSCSSISKKISRCHVESDSEENSEDNLLINPYKKIKLAQDTISSEQTSNKTAITLDSHNLSTIVINSSDSEEDSTEEIDVIGFDNTQTLQNEIFFKNIKKEKNIVVANRNQASDVIEIIDSDEENNRPQPVPSTSRNSEPESIEILDSVDENHKINNDLVSSTFKWEELPDPEIIKKLFPFPEAKARNEGGKYKSQSFLVTESRLMIHYLIVKNKISEANSCYVWENFRNDGYLRHRSVESLRNHVRKVILKNLENYNLPKQIYDKLKKYS